MSLIISYRKSHQNFNYAYKYDQNKQLVRHNLWYRLYAIAMAKCKTAVTAVLHKTIDTERLEYQPCVDYIIDNVQYFLLAFFGSTRNVRGWKFVDICSNIDFNKKKQGNIRCRSSKVELLRELVCECLSRLIIRSGVYATKSVSGWCIYRLLTKLSSILSRA